LTSGRTLYSGISPKVLPTASTACRISRDHRRLAVLHRFPINRIADHLGEGGDAWIFGDEAVIPAFLHWADQHQFEAPLPDDPAAQPFKHRPAFPAISRIGLRAGRLAAVRIGRLLPQPHQIEHVDRAWPVVGPKLREYFLGRIDVAHGGFLSPACPSFTTRRRTS
jgi:hypothetical protein